MKLKIGDWIKSPKLKGRGVIVGLKGEETLIECEDKEDGKQVFSALFGVKSLQNRASLRRLKRKDLVFITRPEVEEDK